MAFTRVHMFVIAIVVVLLVIGAWLVDAGQFGGPPRAEAVFGSWAYDVEEAESYSAALAERMRAQGADPAVLDAMRNAASAASRQQMAMTLAIADGTVSLSEAPGKERSWAATFIPAKPDLVRVASEDGSMTWTFRVLARNRIDLLPMAGSPIPFVRAEAK